jgi:hypothetical protein
LILNLPQICFSSSYYFPFCWNYYQNPTHKCFSILPFTWRRWKTCGESVSACLLFQTNSKTNNVCVFVLFIFLFPSLSLSLSISIYYQKHIYCLMCKQSSSIRTERDIQFFRWVGRSWGWGIP